ncbi:MAG TPA: hypothetical protein DCX03_06465 [Bacteroidales bacterium]|nr:hypothetical protein [Bacteroidales bacterium]
MGVPGYETALIEHAGYIYYPLLYGTIIATGLAFYSALTKGSLFYTIMALILFGGLALSEMLLGWKGGPIYTALILVMIYYYVSRYELRKINTQVRRYVVGAFLVMVLGAVIMYPIVSQYRYAVLMLFGQVDLGAFGEIIKAYALDIQDIRWTSEFLLRRVSGLDNVIPIVAYLQQGAGSNLVDPPSFFANLFGMEIKPEQFYTWYILGVDPNIITTNAPTGWGALYIYGGIMSVLFGMLIIGILSSLFYLTLLSNTHRDGRWVVFYSIFMVNIFLPVVFEGTMINYCKKHFLALAFMYMLSIFVLTSIRYHIPKKLQGGGFCAGKN